VRPDRVVLVAGTRPEFVKLHPIALALREVDVETILITTNQHRTAEMKDSFIEQLSWPCQVESLAVTAQDTLSLLAEILTLLPPHLRKGDLVVAEGDTTSVLGASLVANKLGMPLAHVEAGLRSYDLRMPEEHNRRICDHLADYLFAPTEFDAGHLREERVMGRVFVVGNTVLDAVRQNVARLDGVPKTDGGFVLVTLHRKENVDDPAFLRELFRFLESSPLPCVFPVHPRTGAKLSADGLWEPIARLSHVRVSRPLDYLSFLAAMRDARVIVTDSGGVQEEATAPEIRRPVVVVRRSTERVPAVEACFSLLAPPDAGHLLRLVSDLSWFRPTALSPFGDGRSGERIARVLSAPPEVATGAP
jgi:UDP-N-acetylglucosamine 2-epimerase (non-hydrolysing)